MLLEHIEIYKCVVGVDIVLVKVVNGFGYCRFHVFNASFTVSYICFKTPFLVWFLT